MRGVTTFQQQQMSWVLSTLLRKVVSIPTCSIRFHQHHQTPLCDSRHPDALLLLVDMSVNCWTISQSFPPAVSTFSSHATLGPSIVTFLPLTSAYILLRSSRIPQTQGFLLTIRQSTCANIVPRNGGFADRFDGETEGCQARRGVICRGQAGSWPCRTACSPLRSLCRVYNLH